MTQAADEFRPDIPSTARIYDYYLGGKDNYPADRAAAEHIIASMPSGVVRTAAVQNRKFLMRAVRYLAAERGIRQFLDIGTGLPTMNSVHQVAQSIAPESRVVYVDHDPIVLAHSRNLLHGNEHATVIRQDLRDPAGILADPQLRATLDFRQPVAVLLVAVLHFVADAEDPYGVVKALMDPMPAGSYLVISHFTADSFDEQADAAAQGYRNATSSVHHRTRAQIASFFAGYDLIDPGEPVWAPRWRRDADAPDDDPEVAVSPGRSLSWCGVARKPGPGRPEALPATAVSLGLDGAPALSGPRVTSLASSAAINPDATASSAQLYPDVPNVARMYDYMLGGKDNYPADRAAAQRTFAVLGEEVVRGTVLQNRQFLGRAVRYLAAERGIRQFLDIGTGLPTMNSVHEVTQSVAPASRVVYVDNDPVVLAHARDMLHGLPGTMITNHDLRDPRSIVNDPRVRVMLDFDEPVAVLLIAVLHFVADAEDPAGIVAELMAATPPGSCLVISHLTADHYTRAEQVEAIYADTTPGLHLRSRAAIESLFCGLPLLPPGELTYTGDWHPDADTPPASSPGGSSIWCGTAGKP